MQAFRFLVLLLVISINVGHGYPRAGKRLDLTDEQLDDNVTGEQLGDNVTGEQLNENFTDEHLDENVTDEHLDENVTDEHLDENVTGEHLNQAKLHVVNKNLNDEVPVPGCKRDSFYWNKCNICHCSKAGTVECTAKKCDSPKGSKKLNKNLNSAHYEKLRDLATGCVPGQKVSSDNCECECSIHSVLLCHCPNIH